jgi:hypothetical protein
MLIRTPPGPAPPVVPAGTGSRSVTGDLRAGLTYVRSITGLPALMLMSAGLKFFVTPFTVLLAFYVEGHLGVPADWYGFLVAGMGAGAVAGYVISGVVRIGPRLAGPLIVAAIGAQSLAMTALAIASTPAAALVLFTLAGVMNGFVNVRFMTLLQLAVAVDMRGRVFGLLRTITEALIPIATVLAGVVADLMGRNVPLVYAGCGVALLSISAAIATSRSCRAFLSGEMQPAVIAPGDARELAGTAAAGQ